MTTYSSRHEGIHRIVSAVEVIKRSLGSISIARFIPAALMTGAVTAILVGASHLLADLFDDGALMEWLLMWGIALVAVWLLAGHVRAASTSILAAGSRFLGRRRTAWLEAQYADLARIDPRIAADLRAAKLHAERLAETQGG